MEAGTVSIYPVRLTFPEEFLFGFQYQGILIDAVNTLEIPLVRLVNMLQVYGKWDRLGYATPGEDRQA